MRDCILVWLALAAAFGSSGPAEAQPANASAPNPTIDQILAVWKTRQEKVQSARFELSVEQTIHKGSVSILAESAPGELDPPRDYIVTGTAGVSLSGSKLRYWYDRPQWDPVGKALHPSHFVDTYDGERYKQLRNPSSAQNNYPLAGIKPAQGSESAFQFPIAALFLTFRGDHPQFYRDLNKFAVTGRTIPIASRRCVELVRASAGSDRREVFFLDAEREYIVVRKATLRGEQPMWQLDIAYRQDPTVGWVPSSWEYVIRVGKVPQPHESGRYTVTKYEINPALDAGEFDIAFPPGTRVLDKSSGQEVQYIVRENREKGREIPTASNPTYQDLEKASARFNRVIVLVVWGVVFALAGGGWLWLRHWRKKTAGNTPAMS
jgi:hypothetical protein